MSSNILIPHTRLEVSYDLYYSSRQPQLATMISGIFETQIADILKQLREDKKLTQTELATAVSLPLETIKRLESTSYSGDVITTVSHILSFFGSRLNVTAVPIK